MKIAISDSTVVPPGSEGLTSCCVAEARRCLEQAGFEVQVYPATGGGGRAFESAVKAGGFAGVLDLTATELAEEIVGVADTVGPDRMTAAALCGVPQLIVPGAVDAVIVGEQRQLLRGRRILEQAPGVTLIRTDARENDRVGREIALRASASRGPVAVLLPLCGLSSLDREGQAFWWPDADAALLQSIRNWIAPQVKLIALDRHLNDPDFAAAAVRVLLEMVGSGAV